MIIQQYKFVRQVLFWIIAICFGFISMLVSANESCNEESLFNDDLEELKYFLKTCNVTKEQLNPTCSGGLCRPVIMAAHHGSLERMKLLVDAGADINVNSGGTSGDTPLIISIIRKNREMINYLVKLGADVNQPNNWGVTPFLGAINNIELTRLFLKHGADVNSTMRYKDLLTPRKNTVDGMTAMMLAAYKGNATVVQLLLQNKADVTLKDSLGRTAVDYARFNKHNHIVQMLLK